MGKIARARGLWLASVAIGFDVAQLAGAIAVGSLLARSEPLQWFAPHEFMELHLASTFTATRHQYVYT
eukprot:687243-Pyramimonas_sp.AAC.1